jgi:glycosyltransferase involved in cell wall biosynthesis
MKILHVITTIDRGGAENQLLVLAKKQAQMGHNVCVLPLKGDFELQQEFIGNGVDVDMSVLTSRFLIGKFLNYKSMIRSYKPDIVHAHLPQAEIFSAIKIRNYRLILSKHNAENFAPKRSKILSLLLSRFVACKSDSIIAISGAVKKFLIDSKEISNKQEINVVYYGFDDDIYQDKSSSKPLTSKNLLKIATVGRLVRQKDHPTTLKAIQLCIMEGMNTELHVYGEGILREELMDLTSRLKITENVKWHGRTNNIRKVLLESDVLVLSSVYEGFGLVLLEAIQANIPILAANSPAVVEVLGRNYLGLFEISNYEQLGGLLKKVREKDFSILLVNQLFNRKNIYDPNTMVQKIQNIYLES